MPPSDDFLGGGQLPNFFFRAFARNNFMLPNFHSQMPCACRFHIEVRFYCWYVGSPLIGHSAIWNVLSDCDKMCNKNVTNLKNAANM